MFGLGFYLGGGVGFCGGLVVAVLLHRSAILPDHRPPVVSDESVHQSIRILAPDMVGMVSAPAVARREPADLLGSSMDS
jgi:hypothetical protein